jgi:hypothetical protein
MFFRDYYLSDARRRAMQVGEFRPPTPCFFVSAASKGFCVSVSGLESTLADIVQMLILKGLTLYQSVQDIRLSFERSRFPVRVREADGQGRLKKLLG